MKKIRKFILPSIIIAISLIVSFLAVKNWFSGGTVLYYWDTLLSFSKEYTFAFLYPWNSINFPGFAGSGLSWILYVFPFTGLEKIFSSLSFAQATIYITLIFFSILSFYFLVSYLAKIIFVKNYFFYNFIFFIFSVMYALNLYTFYYAYFLFNPEAYIIAFLPLNFLALLKIFPLEIKSEKINFKIWFLVFFISLVFMSPGFTTYIFFFQYLVWVFFYLFIYFFISKEQYKNKFLKSLLFFILVVLINWWWFFPAYLNIHSQYTTQRFTNDPTAYIALNSKNSNLLNSLRLTGSTQMTNNPFSWYGFYMEKNPFNFLIFLFPFLIIFILFNIKDLSNKGLILFLLSMFLVSLFLVKEGNPPRADFTTFLFQHIPFFDAFRDAQHKAGLYFTFAYFILAFIGFVLLIKFFEKRNIKTLNYLSFFLLVLTLFIITGPFFLFRNDNVKKIKEELNGKKYLFSAKTSIPKEYYDLKNFLEKDCQSKVTLQIPRASDLSNAVWDKYGISYIGQEILSHFINCNIISSKIGENNPDAFNNVPYLMLRNNDFPSFKKFLIQNSVNLVLIRKDNIPLFYTSWFEVDPKKAKGLIEKDSDFKKIFENSFFDLYRLKNKDSANFGFSIPQQITYTNSSLSSTNDYFILSKATKTNSFGLLVNEDSNFKKYKNNINQYVAVGNCVGCVEIQNSLDIGFSSESFTALVKDFIKEKLGLFRKSEPIEIQISKNIINSNVEFNKLIKLIKEGNQDDIEKSVKNYSANISKIVDLLKNNHANFFERNQKFMETRNYLTPQNTALFRAISNFSPSKNLEIRTLLNFLLEFQNQNLSYIDKNLWQTDKRNKIYRTRLDIPKEGDYECKADPINEGVKSLSVYLGIGKEPLGEVNHFKKGSYPVSIPYELEKKVDLKEAEVNPIKEIELNNLRPGDYSISFDVGDIKSTLAIFLTKKRVDISNLSQEIFSSSNQVLFYDYIVPGANKFQHKRSFHLDPLSNEHYFFYIIIPRYYSQSISSEKISNLLIERSLSEDDISFYCKLAGAIDPLIPLKVEKKSVIEYEIEMPKKSKANFLLFNQSFHNDWSAYDQAGNKLKHLKSGYSNAWDLSNVTGNKIRVLFQRQDLIIKNIIASLVLFVLGSLLFLRINKNE